MGCLAICTLCQGDIPTDSTGASDASRVLELIDGALPHFCQDVTLVLMSQVAPSFTRRLAERIRTSRPELRFTLYYWVETLIFGRAVERYLGGEGGQDASQHHRHKQDEQEG